MERRGNAKYSTRKRIDEPGSLASEGVVVHFFAFVVSHFKFLCDVAFKKRLLCFWVLKEALH
jgi:hypothetical protein